jgi:hypothetical protein
MHSVYGMKSTQLGGLPEETLARLLLSELIPKANDPGSATAPRNER